MFTIKLTIYVNALRFYEITNAQNIDVSIREIIIVLKGPDLDTIVNEKRKMICLSELLKESSQEKIQVQTQCG